MMYEKRIPKIGEQILSISQAKNGFWTEVVDVFVSKYTNDYIILDSDGDIIKSDEFGLITFYSVEDAEKVFEKINVD